MSTIKNRKQQETIQDMVVEDWVPENVRVTWSQI